MLERYGHGGDVRTASEAFGLAADAFLDFSANMNPLGPSAATERIIAERWRDIASYPDPASRELVKAIAGKYAIPEDSILVGNGAAELIDLLVRKLSPKITGLAQPSFSEYEQAVRHSGGRVYAIPLLAENGFELQWDAVEHAMDRTDLLFLGHPNNPTGKLLPQRLIDAVVHRKHPLILDEAFVDFSPNEEGVSRIRQAAANRDLYVIRSMTKFYTVPGIRLGFLVAHPDYIRELREAQVPWSVNFLAQALGKAALEDDDYAATSRAWLLDERPWLTSRLRELGLYVCDSDTNFLLFGLPQTFGLNIKQLQFAMGRKGIMLRDASLFPGLDDRYGRTAIRLRAENEKLLAALRQALEEGAAKPE